MECKTGEKDKQNWGKVAKFLEQEIHTLYIETK
jgi:hypothetical protein